MAFAVARPKRARRIRSLWAYSLALGAAGCASGGTRQEGGAAAPLEPEIEAVVIAGHTDTSTSDLTDGLANRPPSGFIFHSYTRLDRLALEVDRRRVESFFRQRGYFTVKVSDAEIRDGKEGRVIVRFPVDEGPPARIVRMILTGAPPGEELSEAQLEALTELEVGAPFDYDTYVAAKEKIRTRFYRAGYARATVEGRAEVQKRTAEVLVRFKLDPGPLAHFGQARVRGETKLPHDSILARVAWAPGERFDPAELKVTERRIYELGLAGSVRFELEGEPTAEVVDIGIFVSDTTPHELRLGGGGGVTAANYEIHGIAAYIQRDFFDPLNSFRADLKPLLTIQKADGSLDWGIQTSAEVERMDMFISRLRSTVGAAFTVEQYEVYKTLGPSVSLGFSRPVLIDSLFAGVRFRLQSLHVSNTITDPVMVQRSFGIFVEDSTDPKKLGQSTESLFFAEPAITLDLRDDPMSPKHGGYFDLHLELGHLLSGPSTNYMKLIPEARGYLPVGTERLILAARVKWGAVLSSGGALPLTRRFVAGGSESIRSFGRRRLSPTLNGPSGPGPVGGEALLDSSAELRLDLFKLFGNWFGIVGFVDAGDVTPLANQLDLGHLHIGVGPGLRYHTPIGPVRLDVGFRMNRMGPSDPDPGSSWALQFSLGEAF